MGDYFILRNQRVRDLAKAAIDAADADRVVRILDKTRTLEQNAKMWAMLEDIARQLPWPVDGVERLLDKEEWKVVLTAGLRREQHVAAGINGGFVLLGEKTSKMTVREMAELVEFIYWFGAEKKIDWSEPLEVLPPDLERLQ